MKNIQILFMGRISSFFELRKKLNPLSVRLRNIVLYLNAVTNDKKTLFSEMEKNSKEDECAIFVDGSMYIKFTDEEIKSFVEEVKSLYAKAKIFFVSGNGSMPQSNLLSLGIDAIVDEETVTGLSFWLKF